MSIFKLIFEHDLLLEQLASNADPLNLSKAPMSLEDFMRPIPTYSKFYLTGTVLRTSQQEHQFGLSILPVASLLMQAMVKALGSPFFHHPSGVFSSEEVVQRIYTLPLHSGLLVSETATMDFDLSMVQLRADQGVRELHGLKKALEMGYKVVFKEPAHHGFDLHLFSKKNIYPSFFKEFQPLLSQGFRFFSINGKKVGSERTFYFETYRLENPPHGFEEVFPESVLLG